MTLPDISDYYDEGDRARQAELDWVLNANEGWRQQAAFLLPRLREVQAKTVVEFGPGCGLLAAGLVVLDPFVDYLGVEKSVNLLAACGKRRAKLQQWKTCKFVLGDVREYQGAPRDVAVAFKFLKHFSLEDFGAVLARVLRAGRYAAFHVQITPEPLDTGTEFPHTFVTEAAVTAVLRLCGHKELSREVWSEGRVDGMPLQQVAFWTGRVEDVGRLGDGGSDGGALEEAGGGGGGEGQAPGGG